MNKTAIRVLLILLSVMFLALAGYNLYEVVQWIKEIKTAAYEELVKYDNWQLTVCIFTVLTDLFFSAVLIYGAIKYQLTNRFLCVIIILISVVLSFYIVNIVCTIVLKCAYYKSFIYDTSDILKHLIIKPLFQVIIASLLLAIDIMCIIHFKKTKPLKSEEDKQKEKEEKIAKLQAKIDRLKEE